MACRRCGSPETVRWTSAPGLGAPEAEFVPPPPVAGACAVVSVVVDVVEVVDDESVRARRASGAIAAAIEETTRITISTAIRRRAAMTRE